MNGVAAQKCVRHAAREAVARCQSCSGHFCRECVVEHMGTLWCASCLSRSVAVAPTVRAEGSKLGRAARTIACGLLAGAVFYGVGQILKLIPPKVHEGTVWRTLAE